MTTPMWGHQKYFCTQAPVTLGSALKNVLDSRTPKINCFYCKIKKHTKSMPQQTG